MARRAVIGSISNYNPQTKHAGPKSYMTLHLLLGELILHCGQIALQFETFRYVPQLLQILPLIACCGHHKFGQFSVEKILIKRPFQRSLHFALRWRVFQSSTLEEDWRTVTHAPYSVQKNLSMAALSRIRHLKFHVFLCQAGQGNT